MGSLEQALDLLGRPQADADACIQHITHVATHHRHRRVCEQQHLPDECCTSEDEEEYLSADEVSSYTGVGSCLDDGIN